MFIGIDCGYLGGKFYRYPYRWVLLWAMLCRWLPKLSFLKDIFISHIFFSLHFQINTAYIILIGSHLKSFYFFFAPNHVSFFSFIFPTPIIRLEIFVRNLFLYFRWHTDKLQFRPTAVCNLGWKMWDNVVSRDAMQKLFNFFFVFGHILLFNWKQFSALIWLIEWIECHYIRIYTNITTNKAKKKK